VIRRAVAILALAAVVACGIKAAPKPPLPKAGQAPARPAGQPAEPHEEDAGADAAAEPSSCQNGCAEPSPSTTTTTKKAP
jgi:hypothetical protein